MILSICFYRLDKNLSVETVDITVTCPDDGETKVPVTINLEDINSIRTEANINTVMITDKIGMTMKHPTMKQVLSYDLTKMDTMESTFGIIQDCLENIFDENEVYDDMNKKELSEFIEQMTTVNLRRLQNSLQLCLN